MKIHEIMESTTSGCIAPVSMPVGVIQTRGGSLLGGKYTNDPTPNTPDWMKQLKGKRRAK
jgi:hypothetical protein